MHFMQKILNILYFLTDVERHLFPVYNVYIFKYMVIAQNSSKMQLNAKYINKIRIWFLKNIAVVSFL